MQNDILDLGLVVGLDYQNPGVDAQHELQRLKTHPWIRSLLAHGEIIAYGAKSLPEGGWYSLPKLTVGGAMLIGDSAGFLNGQRLKGIHLAMKSGMLAAETISEAFIAEDFSDASLASFRDKVNSSWLKNELWKVRNAQKNTVTLVKNSALLMCMKWFRTAMIKGYKLISLTAYTVKLVILWTHIRSLTGSLQRVVMALVGLICSILSKYSSQKA